MIEGVTAQQADTLAEHGINDIDALARTSVDDLVEFLDLSLDEAETILSAAKAVVAMRETLQHPEEAGVPEEAEAAGTEVEEAGTSQTESMEPEESLSAAEPAGDPTAKGYDEAVESGTPFTAEPVILAQNSADPVAVTESEPLPEAELILQGAGRDLRPDTITPGPDITSSGAAALEYVNEAGESGFSLQELATQETSEGLSTEASEAKTAPDLEEDAASSGSSDDQEKQDASPDAAQ